MFGQEPDLHLMGADDAANQEIIGTPDAATYPVLVGLQAIRVPIRQPSGAVSRMS